MSCILFFLLACSPVYGAGTAAQEAAYQKEQVKQAQSKASKALEQAILKSDFPAIVTWLAAVEDEQERAGAVEFVVGTFQDPAQLQKEHGQKFKQFETEILRYQKNFNELPQIFEDKSVIARWRPFLPRIFPAPVVSLDVDLPAQKVPQKDVKAAHDDDKKVLLFVKGKKDPNIKGVITVPRNLVTDYKIAGMIAAQFEDKDVYEVELPFTFEVMEELVKGFKAIEKFGLAKDKEYRDYSAAEKRAVVLVVEEAYSPAQKLLVPVLKAAHYENSPFLTDLYARAYARYLHDFQQDKTNALKQHKLPNDLLRLVATHYFLQFHEGIDKEVLAAMGDASGRKLIQIPYDMLVAYRAIEPDIVALHPNLQSDLKDKEKAIEMLAELAETNSNALAVKALLRAGASIDFGTGNPLHLNPLVVAMSHDAVDVVRALIDAGADVNAYDSFGMTVWSSAHSPGVRKMLQDAGANSEPIYMPQAFVKLDEYIQHNDPSADAQLWLILKYADPNRVTGAMREKLQSRLEDNDKRMGAAGHARLSQRVEPELAQKWQKYLPRIFR